jgi:L-threonylcarbamoyladenylate synthase
MIDEIKKIVDCLSEGGIILIPTDTVYGLAVSPIKNESVDRLYKIKCRPRNLNLPIMVSSINDLCKIGIDINDNIKRLLLSPFIPGPLTFASGFHSVPLVSWLSGRKEVAIRIPSDVRLLSVLNMMGPLLVTSANKHGMSTCDNVKEILMQLEETPDMVIEGGIIKNIPSTLVNCRLNPAVIERSGSVTENELEKIIELDK